MIGVRTGMSGAASVKASQKRHVKSRGERRGARITATEARPR